MDNPAGYLFRVGQSKARNYRRRRPVFPEVPSVELPLVEPLLAEAMSRLSGRQRVAVVLIHADGMTEREAADLMGLSRATVRRHATRGMEKLRAALEVSDVG
jgi:DNA-directed RNA polymerase specialized sigma24 family protein